MSETCHRYAVLRSQLDELGYLQPLPKDGIRLVDKLLADLVKTTESLQYYKALSNTVTHERDTLLIGTQPYKSDNAKLICELNDLNLELIKVKEEHEYTRNKLESDIRHLNKINRNLDSDKKALQSKIRDLELECAEQTSKILQLNKDGKSKNLIKSPTKSKIASSRSGFSMTKTDSGISGLTERESTRDVSKLKQRCHELEIDMQKLLDCKYEQIDMIDCLQKQIETRDEEIVRLTELLKGGRPIQALSRDYCHNIDYPKRSELKSMKNEIEQLEYLLKDAVNKQHETMTRNLALVERNKQLEKELHEIDKIALDVEKQCNETIHQKKMTIEMVQDKLNSSLDRNRDLERKLMSLRSENEDLLNELKNLKNKKHVVSCHTQTSAIEDECPGRYTQRSHTVDEGLISKIGEMTESNIKLQHKISELEERILHLSQPVQEKVRSISPLMHENSCSRYDCSAHSHVTSFEQQSMCSRNLPSQRHCYPPSETHTRHAQHTYASWKRCLDNFPYKNEIKSPFCKDDCICHKCFQSLSNLINRFEREKEVLRSEIVQLQTERDSLKKRLEVSTEMQVSEHSRLRQSSLQSQERVSKLELEQRELLRNRDNQAAIIRNLEQQCSELREQLSLQEKDTSHHRLSYNQLKVVHDQTERALTNMQQELSDVENKLANSLDRTHTLERERVNLEQECKTVKLDLVNAKTALDNSSKETHTLMIELDAKSEELDKLLNEGRIRDSELLQLRDKVPELKKRLEDALNNRDGAQKLLSKATAEAEESLKEIETLRRDCEHYSRENRRLQDELSTTTCDLRSTLRDLENSKKESADLQQQLQQYVARVRHAEDIITMKETERTELLEQFRNLSQEATVLETNNHTLESNIADNQMRLHVTGQRAEDLEMRMQEKEAALHEKEIEITGLRSRIVTLETESDHYKQSLRRAKDDLMNLRELCVDLDKQKDSLAHESGRLHNDRCQTEQQVNELRMERDSLQQDLDREISAKNGLEALLETSRREAIDQRLLVQELIRELGELRNKVQDLMSKLENEREQVRRYQAQAHEYSVQVQELRRQITNERYRLTQLDEERPYFTTL